MTSTSSQDLFARWVEAPISILRKLPNGDGGFAALAISLGLYERLIDSVLHRDGMKATPENFRAKASEDLGVEDSVVDRFWNGYRLGLMHAFHPKNYVEKAGTGDAWGWELSEGKGYESYPIVEKRSERSFVIKLDPWKFTEHVLHRWRANSELMNQLTEFAFGQITQKTVEAESVTLHPSFSSSSGENFKTHSLKETTTGQHPSTL